MGDDCAVNGTVARVQEARMGIKSTAFGRVVLTDADAKKFKNQITYGKPKKAAAEGVSAGLKLNKELQANGSITFRLRETA